jgi:hypothetical protein
VADQNLQPSKFRFEATKVTVTFAKRVTVTFLFPI